ncbi:MAG TPA: ATP-binding protein [Thermoanaerobaculia bacterium]|jgi:sensor histidine kinase regulating citrate/malate metabolism
MTSFTITPGVNAVQEFIEISQDFANPLDLVREAISNAFDAQATEITLHFDVEKEHGESLFVITLQDDGMGITREGLQSFFDLGNSSRRNDPNTIGEKGHGTKVYFNSRRVDV